MTDRPIREFMTEAVHTIGVDRPAAVAKASMSEFNIRHLPVLKGGKVVGLVSDRDLQWLASLKDVDLDTVAVEEAMASEVFCVAPDVALKTVARTMADQKIGSAVVMQGREVLGIFTTSDALEALATLE